MRTALIGCFVLATRIFAADSPPLVNALRQNALPLKFASGSLSGPGAERLDRELASTQFFLVGEDHGTSEMARLVSALFARGHVHGYRHLAIEVGPITTAGLVG